MPRPTVCVPEALRSTVGSIAARNAEHSQPPEIGSTRDDERPEASEKDLHMFASRLAQALAEAGVRPDSRGDRYFAYVGEASPEGKLEVYIDHTGYCAYTRLPRGRFGDARDHPEATTLPNLVIQRITALALRHGEVELSLGPCESAA